MKIKMVDGGVTTIERDRYRLVVVTDAGGKIEALSEDFDALLDLQRQLAALGYAMHRFESIGALMRG